MKTALIVLALLIASSSQLLAQSVPPESQRFGSRYLTGRAGLKHFDSGLTITDDRIIVTTSKKKNGAYVEAFSIPISSVVSAEVRHDRREEGALAHVLIGIPSTTGNYEYVSIATENATGAEVLVFQVTGLEGAGIAAKINFAVKQHKARTEVLP